MSCTKSQFSSNTKYDYPTLTDTIPGPPIQIDSFPLKVGNTWTYTTGSNIIYTVKVVADTMINSERAARVDMIGDSTISTSYYANRSDGYYLVANRYYSFLDSLHIFKPAVHVLSFPLATNATWQTGDSSVVVYYQSNYSATWGNFYKVTTPAGQFNCCLLNLYSLYNGLSYSCYYSSKGLMKEVEIASASKGPGLGPYSFVAGTITLTSVNF